MDSAKPTLAVALADELHGKGWRRSRTHVRVVAVLCSLLAAGILYALFDQFRVVQGEAKPEKQLIAAVDLRIGNPAGAAERGEARARADLEAGLLQLQTFAPVPRAGKAALPKAQHGVTWVHKPGEATPLNQAFVDAYNRVMQAEIERRDGPEVLAAVLRTEPAGAPPVEKAR